MAVETKVETLGRSFSEVLSEVRDACTEKEKRLDLRYNFAYLVIDRFPGFARLRPPPIDHEEGQRGIIKSLRKILINAWAVESGQVKLQPRVKKNEGGKGLSGK